MVTAILAMMETGIFEMIMSMKKTVMMMMMMKSVMMMMMMMNLKDIAFRENLQTWRCVLRSRVCEDVLMFVMREEAFIMVMMMMMTTTTMMMMMMITATIYDLVLIMIEL